MSLINENAYLEVMYNHIYVTLFGVTWNWVFYGKQLTSHQLHISDCIEQMTIDTQTLLINTNHGITILGIGDSSVI